MSFKDFVKENKTAELTAEDVFELIIKYDEEVEFEVIDSENIQEFQNDDKSVTTSARFKLKLLSDVRDYSVDPKTKESIEIANFTGAEIYVNINGKLNIDNEGNEIFTISKKAPRGKVVWSTISKRAITIDIGVEHLHELIGHKFKTHVSADSFKSKTGVRKFYRFD